MTQPFRLSFQSPSAPAPVKLSRHELFPTVIWQARLAQFDTRLAAWCDTVEAMRAASPVPAGRTNRAGWNSQDNAVLDHAGFAPLGDEVRRIATGLIHEMAGAERAFVLQSWVNMHDRGGFNFLHMHDNVLLSGCFYIRVPPGSGALVFRDPRPGVLHSSFKGNGPNAGKDIRLAPSAGLLVLFPHWLEHFVEPHEHDQPRIAIAFNALTP
jgi:uncharacterized protein (TIGR02466 family)